MSRWILLLGIVIVAFAAAAVDVYIKVPLTDQQYRALEHQSSNRGVNVSDMLVQTNIAIADWALRDMREKSCAMQFQQLLKLWTEADHDQRAAAIQALRKKQ